MGRYAAFKFHDECRPIQPKVRSFCDRFRDCLFLYRRSNTGPDRWCSYWSGESRRLYSVRQKVHDFLSRTLPLFASLFLISILAAISFRKRRPWARWFFLVLAIVSIIGGLRNGLSMLGGYQEPAKRVIQSQHLPNKYTIARNNWDPALRARSGLYISFNFMCCFKSDTCQPRDELSFLPVLAPMWTCCESF